MIHSPLAMALVGAFSFATMIEAQTTTSPDVKPTTPWMDTNLSADARVDLLLQEMTLGEKLRLTFGYFSTEAPWQTTGTKRFEMPKEGLPHSAGFVPGIPRLGIPNQWQTDAGVGVATQRTKSPDQPRARTALPSGIATAATWNPDLAEMGGAMIGKEAFLSGFNVQLAGGMNLMREPRNGRNFEYSGEDPLLAGTMTGHQIKGIQSNHIISTMKHFAFNGQETNRMIMDHQINDQAARESDLLAFQIAFEIGNPGSVMGAYNRVNGAYACENDWLLNQVLKTDWGFKGYVMSDWGATHSTIPAANHGLDQESGWGFDRSAYFEGALREAVNNGHVSEERANDMARRILWAMFEHGLFDHPVQGDQSASIDFAAHAKITQADAEEAIVLLKNNASLLPLSPSLKSILIVGSHADVGVLSGGGSSQVYPVGGSPVPDEFHDSFPGPKTYYPSSPMKSIQVRTTATVTYLDGKNLQIATDAAKKADVVIVFGEQWTAESLDVPNLNLPNEQDALISALAEANSKTIVVLETGGPVVMPWLSKIGAVVEAWYPGTAGGEAIARVLTGEINPSGHLPVTFPASLEQTPRPVIEGDLKLGPDAHPIGDYNIEGAAVGYKWFDKKALQPLFPFGHGLSYTTFEMTDLVAEAKDQSLTATFKIKNTGAVAGKKVVQIYVSPVKEADWEAPKRLAAFQKVNLQPGETRTITLKVDPRLLATFDSANKKWAITEGYYQVILANSATDIAQTVEVLLAAASLNVKGQ